MRVYVKTLKGLNFEIHVEPHHTIADVKTNIENVRGISVYPAEQQLLIYQGKILKNETTILDNQVAEDSFLVIMLSKTKASANGACAPKVLPATQTPSTSPSTLDTPVPALQEPPAAPALSRMETDTYEQAESNLVAGNNFEKAVQDILEMGGGTWDRDTVVRAMRAAFNNPERAINYLYSGIPEQAEAPPVCRALSGAQPTNPATPATQPENAAPTPSGDGPNTNPLNLFPQDLPSNMGSVNAATRLESLRNCTQFQSLQARVQANPELLPPIVQGIRRLNPQTAADFLQLINEPRGESNLLGNLEDGSLSQSVQVAPEEAEAIARLEAMGFERTLVLQVFIACDRNEELAANQLLDLNPEFFEDNGHG